LKVLKYDYYDFEAGIRENKILNQAKLLPKKKRTINPLAIFSQNFTITL
jgi:hypothetical protein